MYVTAKATQVPAARATQAPVVLFTMDRVVRHMLDPVALVLVIQAIHATMGLVVRHIVDQEAPSIGDLVVLLMTVPEVRHILALVALAMQAPVVPAIQGLVAQEKAVLRYANDTPPKNVSQIPPRQDGLIIFIQDYATNELDYGTFDVVYITLGVLARVPSNEDF